MIPKDPVMLLSFINLKLRDFYKSLDACCEDLDLEKEELIRKKEDCKQENRRESGGP